MAGNRSLGSLVINLIAKVAGFEQGMDKAARAADKRMKQIEASAKRAGVAIGAIGGAAVAGVGVIVRNTMQAEKSLAQLDAILKSTGNAAGYTRNQLVEMARGFQQASTFSTNEVIEAQTRLLSYSGILGENIPRAMQTVIDQATRLGMSVSQSAETIGRALESPSKAAAALAQQGFGAAFTKEVRASIDALVAAGREGEAQIKILEILEESYGGAAEAARNTFGGALSALQNTLGDLLSGDDDSLTGLTQAVNELIDTLNDPDVRNGFQFIVKGATEAATAVVNLTSEFGRAISKYREWLADAGRLPANMLDNEEQIKERIRKLSRIIHAGNDPLNQVRMALFGDDFRAQLRAAEQELKRFPFRNVISGASSMPVGGAQPTGGGNPLGGGGRVASLPDFAKDAHDELRRLIEAQQRARFEFEEWEAQLAGPVAAANFQFAVDLERLNELASKGEVAAENLADAQAKLRAQHEKNIKALEAQLTPAQEALRLLEGEAAWLRANAEGQRELAAARLLGADATAEEIKQATEYMRVNEALAESIRNMDQVRGEFSDFFTDTITGAKSVSDAFKDMADNIAGIITRLVAEQWAEKLFGGFGTSGTGANGGSWIDSLWSLFGGGSSGWGWADGGYTGAGGKYEPAGIVHAGEFVVQADAVKRIGLPFLEAMNSMKKLPGFAEGGYVDAWATNERGSEMASLSGVPIGRPKLAIPSIRQKEIA